MFIAYISLLNTNIDTNLIDLSSSVLTFKYKDSNLALKSSSYRYGLLFLIKKYIPGGNEIIHTKNMTVNHELMISSLLPILKCYNEMHVLIQNFKYTSKRLLNILLKNNFRLMNVTTLFTLY